MKVYVKPELEIVKFISECITDFGSGSGETASNVFGEDDFS